MKNRQDAHDENYEDEQDGFDEMFPQIDALEVNFVQCPDSFGKDDKDIKYQEKLEDKNTIFRRIRCTNWSCNDGGYSFLDKISEMVKNRVEIKEDKIHCCGIVKAPKGRQKLPQYCGNYIKYKISITYKAIEQLPEE